MSTNRLQYIERLRFPLACCVVLIHCANSVWREALCEQSSLWEVLMHWLSHSLPSFAVPLFFALSGYLFFLRPTVWNGQVYFKKLERRVFTLLVPYLCWNLLACALYAVQARASGLPWPLGNSLVHVFWGYRELRGATFNAFGFPLEATLAPAQIPLWFVRDLMLLVILSPLLRWLLRHAAWPFLALVGTAYYLELWPCYGGVTLIGLWYFSLGAWFGVRGLDPLQQLGRLSRLALPTAVLLLVALACLPEGFWYSVAQALYVLAAMLAAAVLAQRPVHGSRRLQWLAASSFFVYASHTIVLFPLSRVLAGFVAPLGPAASFAAYLLCLPLTVGLCLAAYALLTKSLPRAAWLLTGGRK